LDPSGEPPVNAWVLHDAWPCRWSGPVFDAMTAAVAMEEIELCFDRVSWEYPQDDQTGGNQHADAT
jgi:phage tail-like protein